MSDHTVITGAVAGLMTGSVGYVGAEVVRGWRERRVQRLAQDKAPSEIEATISAGARDAVSALRETLAEYRADLAQLRTECDVVRRELTEERTRRRMLERKVAELERRLARGAR